MATTERSKRRPSSATLTKRLRDRRVTKRLAPTANLVDALGASRAFPVKSKPHGPYGVAALLDEIQRRLVSRGGRPSDPSPTIRRLVPFKTQVWRLLQRQADQLSGLGKPISPGQLAAMLLEKSVETLDVVDEDTVTVHESRVPFVK